MSSTEKATRCMPISLGRVGSVSIASGGMYSKSSRRPLPSGVWSIATLAWLPVEADGGVGPLSTDRVTAENGQPEVSEEGDRRFQVADGNADVLQLDAHGLHATESGRRVQVRELPVPAQPDKELSRSCAARGPLNGTPRWRLPE